MLKLIAALLVALVAISTGSAKGGPSKYTLELLSQSNVPEYFWDGSVNVRVAWDGRKSNLYTRVGISTMCGNDFAWHTNSSWIRNDGTPIDLKAYYRTFYGNDCKVWAFTDAGKNPRPERAESNVIQFIG